MDDEEDEKPSQGASKVHRAVFPRDFGRQNAKDVERRVELVIGYGSMPLLKLYILENLPWPHNMIIDGLVEAYG